MVDRGEPCLDHEAVLAMAAMFRTRKAPQSPQHLLAKTRLYLAACRSSAVDGGGQYAVTGLDEKWRLDA
jgi:hypothetical protein